MLVVTHGFRMAFMDLRLDIFIDWGGSKYLKVQVARH